MIKNFNDLWQEHFKWSQGVLVKKVISLKTADIYVGNTPDAWYNFALFKADIPVEAISLAKFPDKEENQDPLFYC